MTPDGELLRRYAETQAEEAFAELLGRHLDLVYSAARRQVNGDAHLAQDVAQTVFTELARKAATLSLRPSLTGWLYTCTHYAAVKAIRTERRRHTREREAQDMHDLLHTPPADLDWDQLRPVLDGAMHKLKESDREVVLMRYFENRQLADIGQKLGLSEDAARKRVDRALDRLRAFLPSRGVATGAALGAALSANAIQVAPAGVAATLTSASMLGAAAAGSGTTITLLQLMTMTKLKLGIIGAVIVAGVATPLAIRYQANLRRENDSLRLQMAQLSQLAEDNARLSNLVTQARNSPSPPDGQLDELLRLRGEVGSLRRQTNELAKLQSENSRLRSSLAAANKRPKQGTPAETTLENVPKELWNFVGYADPESAFQSAIWAKSQGDTKTFLASISPDGAEYRSVLAISEQEFAAKNKEEFAGITGFKIIDKQIVSNDEVILTIYASGINHSARAKLQRYGEEWKLAGPIKDPPGPK